MFVTTLPILFAFTHLVSPFEISMLLLAILVAVYLITPVTHQENSPLTADGLYDYLFSAWIGEMSLGWVFWPFFLLVNGVFFYIDYRVDAETYTINSWKTVHLMLFLPIVWWILSIWRCSMHTRSKLWSSLARAITLYLVFDFLFRLILSFQYPTTLFSCRLLLIEYGDCL